MTLPHLSRRAVFATAAAIGLSATAARAAPAATGSQPGAVTRAPLPDGFAPEGIAIDQYGIAYVGSRVTGAIQRIDLAFGENATLAEGPGTPSLGMKADHAGRLFVAGGTGGDVRVLDTTTGETLASYPLGGGFVNDVLLTPDAAYLTDSYRPALYVLPLGPGGGLPAAADVVTVPLTGIAFTPEAINVNGVATTPDGRALLVIHSTEGYLYRVDPVTGEASPVDLEGETLVNGDGLLRQGDILYVVRNRANEIAVLMVDPDGYTGAVLDHLSDAAFDTPTTAAEWAGRLYLPNARFTTEVTETTTYDVVSVPHGQRHDQRQTRRSPST
jgi:sugar lactone lactonase YvrE